MGTTESSTKSSFLKLLHDSGSRPDGTISSHILTCNGEPVHLWMWIVIFTAGLSGYVIPEANGRKRDETEIQRLQKVPLLLQAGKDPRRDDEKEQRHDDGQAGSMYGGQLGFRHGPSTVEVGHRASTHLGHNPLHHNREEEERDGDAKEGVEDAEGLPFI